MYPPTFLFLNKDLGDCRNQGDITANINSKKRYGLERVSAKEQFPSTDLQRPRRHRLLVTPQSLD